MSMELEGVSSSFELILKGGEKVSKQLDDIVSQIASLDTVEIGKKGFKLNFGDVKKEIASLKKELASSYKEIANFKIDTKGVFAEGQDIGNALAEGIKTSAKAKLGDVEMYLSKVTQTLADASKLAMGKGSGGADTEAFKQSLVSVSAELRNMRTLLIGAEADVQALVGTKTTSEFARLKSQLVDINSVMKEFKSSGSEGAKILDTSGLQAQVSKALASVETLDARTTAAFSNIQSKLSGVDTPKELNFENVGKAITSNIHAAFSKVKADTRDAMKTLNESVEQISLGDKIAAQIMSPKVAAALVQVRENMDALQAKAEVVGRIRETMTATTSGKEATALGAELKKELVAVENLTRKVAQSNMQLSNEFFANERAMLTSMGAAASQLKTDFQANAAAIQRIADDTMRFKQTIGESVTKLGLGVDVLNQQEAINKNIVAIIRAGGDAEAAAVAEMVRGTNAYKQTMSYAEKLQVAENAIVSSRLSGNQALAMTAALIKEQVNAYKQASIIGGGNEAVAAFDKMVDASKRLASVGSEIKLRENLASMAQTITSGGVPAVDKLVGAISVFEATSGKAFSGQKAEIKMVRTLVDELAKRYEALGASASSSAKTQQKQVAESISAISSTMLQQGVGTADEKAFTAAQKLAEVNRENLAIDELRSNFQDEIAAKFNKIYALQVAGVDVAKNYGRMEELYVQAKRQGLELEDKLIARVKDRSAVMTKLYSEVAGMDSASRDNFLFPAAQMGQLKGMVDTLKLMVDLRKSMDKKGEAATVVSGKTLDVAALEKEIRDTQEILKLKEQEANASLEGERIYAAINSVLDRRKALERDIIETLKISKELSNETIGAYDRYIAMADALVLTTQKGIPVEKELLDLDTQRSNAVRELFTEYTRLASAQIENKGGPKEGIASLQRQHELLKKIAAIADRDYVFNLETGRASVGLSNIGVYLDATSSKLAKLDNMWKGQDKLFGKADAESLRSASQTVQNIRAALQDVVPSLTGAGKGYDSMIDAVMRADLAVGKYTSKLRSFHGEQLSNSASTAKQREETLALTAAMEREMAVIKGMQSALNGADTKLRTVGSSMTEATTDPKSLSDKLAGDPAKLAGIQTAMQRVMESMQAMSSVKMTKGSVLETLNQELLQFTGSVGAVIAGLNTVATVAGKVELSKIAITPEQGAAARAEQEQLILKTIQKQYTELMQGVNVLGNWESLQKNIAEAARQGYDIGRENMSVLTAQESIYQKMFETAKALYNTAESDTAAPKSARVAALEQSLKLLQAIKAADTDMPGGIPGGLDFTQAIADGEKLRTTFGTALPSALQTLQAEAERLEQVLTKAVNAAAGAGSPASGFTSMQKGIEGAVSALNTLRSNTSDTAAYTAASDSIEHIVAGLLKWRNEQEKLYTKDGVVSAEFSKVAATVDNIVGRMANWVNKNDELRASGNDVRYVGADTDIKGIIQALTKWEATQGSIFASANSGAVFDKTAVSMDRIIGHLQDWKNIQDKIYKDGADSGQDINQLTAQRAKVREAEHLLSLMQQMKALSEKISVKTASVGVDSSTLGSAAGVAAFKTATADSPKLYMDVVKAGQEFSGLLALMDKALGKSNSLSKSFAGLGDGLNVAKADINQVNDQLSKYAATKARAAANSAGGSIFDVARMSWFMQLRAFWSMYMGVTQTITAVAEYTHSLAVMKATTEASGKTMAEMNKEFLTLGNNVPIATTKIAESALEVAKAGMSAEETLYIIKAASKLAHATKADLTVVSDVITVAISAWGLAAKESDGIADLLFSAMSRSRASMEGMQQAMGYLSGIAPQANIGFKETLGLLGILTNAGLSMSKAATYSRQVINDLMNPSAKMLTILAQLGIKARDVNPQYNNLADIFKRLAAAGMNVSQAFEGMSVRGANAFSLALNNADKLDAFTEGLVANGALMREYKDTTGDLVSQFQLLMNSFVNVGKASSDAFSPFILGIIDGIRDSVEFTVNVVKGLSEAFGGAGTTTRELVRILTQLALAGAALIVLSKVAMWVMGLRAALMATSVAATATSGALSLLAAHPYARVALLAMAFVQLAMSVSSSMGSAGTAISDVSEKVAQLREEINKINKVKMQIQSDINVGQTTASTKKMLGPQDFASEAGRENSAAKLRELANTALQSGNEEFRKVGENMKANMITGTMSAEESYKLYLKWVKALEAAKDATTVKSIDAVVVDERLALEKADEITRNVSQNVSSGVLKGYTNGLKQALQYGKEEYTLNFTRPGSTWYKGSTGEVDSEALKKYDTGAPASVAQLSEAFDSLGKSSEATTAMGKIVDVATKLEAQLLADKKAVEALGKVAPTSIASELERISRMRAKYLKQQQEETITLQQEANKQKTAADDATEASTKRLSNANIEDIIRSMKELSNQSTSLKGIIDVANLANGTMDGARAKVSAVGEEIGKIMARVALASGSLADMPNEAAKGLVDSIKATWAAWHEELVLGTKDGQNSIQKLSAEVDRFAAKIDPSGKLIDPNKLKKVLGIGTEGLATLRGQTKEGPLDSYGDLQGKISTAASTYRFMDRNPQAFDRKDAQSAGEILQSLIKTQFAYINSMMKTKYAVEGARSSFADLTNSMQDLRDQFGEKVDAANFAEPAYEMADLLTKSLSSIRSDMHKSVLSFNELQDGIKNTKAEYAALGAITGKNYEQARGLVSSYAGTASTVASQMSSVQTKIEASIAKIKEINSQARALQNSILDDESSFLSKMKAIRDTMRNPDDNMKISQENISKQTLDVTTKVDTAGLRGADLEGAIRTLRDSFLGMADQYKYQPASVGYADKAGELQGILASMQKQRMEELNVQRMVEQTQQDMQFAIYRNLESVLTGLMSTLENLNVAITNFGKKNSNSTFEGTSSIGMPKMSKASPEALWIIRQIESGNNANVGTSAKGAKGAMQVLDGTNLAPGYGVTAAKDNSPAERERVGVAYFGAMLDKYMGNVAQAISGYNWGPGNTDKALSKAGIAPGDASKDDKFMTIIPKETQKYVNDFMRLLVEKYPQSELAQATGKRPTTGPLLADAGSSNVATDAPAMDITGSATKAIPSLDELSGKLDILRGKSLELSISSEDMAKRASDAMKEMRASMAKDTEEVGYFKESLQNFSIALGTTKNITVNAATSMLTEIKSTIASSMTETMKLLVNGEGDVQAVFTSLYWKLVDIYFQMLTDLAAKKLAVAVLGEMTDPGIKAAGDLANTAAKDLNTAATNNEAAAKLALSTDTYSAAGALSWLGEAANALAIKMGLMSAPAETATELAVDTAVGATTDMATGGAGEAAQLAVVQTAVGAVTATANTGLNVLLQGANAALMASQNASALAMQASQTAVIAAIQAETVTAQTSINAMLMEATTAINSVAAAASMKSMMPGLGSHEGGLQIPGFSVGGLTSGGNRQKDSMLAALTKGEYVVQEPVVRQYGVEFFHALNAGKAQEAFNKLPGFSETKPLDDGNFAPPQSATTASPKAGQSGVNSGRPSVSITNMVDPKVVERYLATDRGRNVVRNVVSTHPYFKK